MPSPEKEGKKERRNMHPKITRLVVPYTEKDEVNGLLARIRKLDYGIGICIVGESA